MGVSYRITFHCVGFTNLFSRCDQTVCLRRTAQWTKPGKLCREKMGVSCRITFHCVGFTNLSSTLPPPGCCSLVGLNRRFNLDCYGADRLTRNEGSKSIARPPFCQLHIVLERKTGSFLTAASFCRPPHLTPQSAATTLRCSAAILPTPPKFRVWPSQCPTMPSR